MEKYEFKYINDMEEWETEINTKGKIIVDFFATWCRPCKQLDKQILKAKEKYPELKIYKVDIDEADEVSDNFEVENLPTVYFYKDGVKMTFFMGSKYDLFHKKIDELMAS